MSKYYVYALLDPRKNNQPFYIGKGSKGRDKQHLTEEIRSENPFKDAVIDKIRQEGLEPLIERIQENMEEAAAYDYEEWLIIFFGRRNCDKNGILTNIVTNNRPPNHKGQPSKLKGLTLEEIWGEEKAKKFKKEQAVRMKELRKNGMGPLNPPWNKGKFGEYKQTEETGKKISKGLKLAWDNGRMTGNCGKTMTDESNEKRRTWSLENNWAPSEQIQYKKGHSFSQETIEKRRQTRLKNEAERRTKGIPYFKKDR